MYKIVFFGPQGSGKGTQAKFLAEALSIPNISVGHLLRQHIKEQTEIGKIVINYLNKGLLAPSDITTKITIDRLQESDCQNGFILDGYPREREQYDALENFTKITHAIEVWISDKESIDRIGERRSSGCGVVYHLKYNPPLHEGICDKCGDQLFIRDDDQPAQIAERLKIYHEKTEPLIEFYKAQGVHIKINGEKSIAEVKNELFKEMNLAS